MGFGRLDAQRPSTVRMDRNKARMGRGQTLSTGKTAPFKPKQGLNRLG
jgi:hypothetical protein